MNEAAETRQQSHIEPAKRLVGFAGVGVLPMELAKLMVVYRGFEIELVPAVYRVSFVEPCRLTF